ncbi:MAG: PAS domain-containing protein [Lentisphaerae bacterium]|nr:PAS domain-containing protein [Lentisphaerota bacterium]
MNLLPNCVAYSQDPALAQRIKGYLHEDAHVQLVEEPSRLESVLQQYEPTVLFLDLRAEEWRPLLRRIRESLPTVLVVAAGMPGSEPMREIDAFDVYAVEDVEMDRLRLLSVFRRANDFLRLLQENVVLRKDSLRRGADRQDQGIPSQSLPLPPHQFSQAFRNFSSVDAMLERLVEGIVSWARVARAGIFSIARGRDSYRLRAGIRCLDSLRDLDVTAPDPLVRWMKMNAHVISRTTLNHVEDPSDRIMLERSLDTLGAEVIVPLHGRNQIIGWLFVGRHVTGRPFMQTDLENLLMLSEHVSNTLENALLYEEVALQKTLAETLIHSLPAGIVAASADGTIRWFNSTAEEILGVQADTVLNRPLKNGLDGQLAGLLVASLRGDAQDEPAEWVTPRTRRSVSLVVRRLEADSQCLGAVLIIRDMTREKLLREKQEELERSAFWTELSAAMSHEIRNPLVAISTFAQLLPERYSDEEFREQFRDLVTREIGRLNTMMDQINAFANPRKLDFKPVNPPAVLRQAARIARQRAGNDCEVVVSADESIPPVHADEADLTECFGHIVTNAMEAVKNAPSPSIHITIVCERGPDSVSRCCKVHVQDNGTGIPAHIRDNVYSPFCTTKARGIGLGLPLAKRSIADHGGEISISTGPKGTTVSTSLPAATAASVQTNGEQAAHIGRR